ncbi:DeoR/GlpR family DNA-binding transcription regulator [Rhizobium laguerreae]|uniref:DeoR/GlpR family DNA-binding transcription regulator n=2 Tax=Rhizobium laguerreae TaxID=1076926 RepID=UPI001FE0E1EC|nr:DeoR/GlpR family DNA-binding transcription regulator [Rhizobium laguerreae]
MDFKYIAGMQPVFALSRRDHISARLADGQPVVSAELAAEFSVSEDAVRRDLRALAEEGRCRRVYGGALPPVSKPHSMAARLSVATVEKSNLARLAAGTVQEGEYLFLDSGSTNLAIVQYLPEDKNITVATNSIHIAAEVFSRGDLPLMMVGGDVSAGVGGCVDAAAVALVEGLNIDRCFIGACAISPSSGLSVHDFADSIFKRTLIRRSSISVVMVTIDKLHDRAPHVIATGSEIDILIVGNEFSPTDRDALVTAGYSLMKNSDRPVVSR